MFSRCICSSRSHRATQWTFATSNCCEWRRVCTIPCSPASLCLIVVLLALWFEHSVYVCVCARANQFSASALDVYERFYQLDAAMYYDRLFEFCLHALTRCLLRSRSRCASLHAHTGSSTVVDQGTIAPRFGFVVDIVCRRSCFGSVVAVFAVVVALVGA